jgi:hypothetical protein
MRRLQETRSDPPDSIAFALLLRQTAPLITHWNCAQRKADAVITRHLFVAAVFVALVGGAALAQSSDPLVGTWTINAAKSKGVKSGTTVIEAAGKGVKFTVDLVSDSGTKSHWGFTANYDGKDVPVTGATPYGDTVALTRVDDRTVRLTSKSKGKPTATTTIVVAADGKSRTSTTKGTDIKGQPLNVESVYDKQ